MSHLTKLAAWAAVVAAARGAPAGTWQARKFSNNYLEIGVSKACSADSDGFSVVKTNDEEDETLRLCNLNDACAGIMKNETGWSLVLSQTDANTGHYYTVNKLGNNDGECHARMPDQHGTAYVVDGSSVFAATGYMSALRSGTNNTKIDTICPRYFKDIPDDVRLAGTADNVNPRVHASKSQHDTLDDLSGIYATCLTTANSNDVTFDGMFVFATEDSYSKVYEVVCQYHTTAVIEDLGDDFETKTETPSNPFTVGFNAGSAIRCYSPSEVEFVPTTTAAATTTSVAPPPTTTTRALTSSSPRATEFASAEPAADNDAVIPIAIFVAVVAAIACCTYSETSPKNDDN
jgi:hypothetical protein